ncbi:hypothetical protein H310_14625 [Aphanomyces invadans]|uniref:Uncharacterized protein n=1 Tax=Aphanomyces invadans TaxID=157072 RepID=A0A024TB91_9STRA|nr:hypothetical protein H310_14625 [Aphanomyces invadans]ETV90622.1 hypothetical protein H310_14625 [Aphanomyces invadans]|eukprot:XP_008880743.1 hypothetical protein H310_14625 [Aphanomyces invadans]
MLSPSVSKRFSKSMELKTYTTQTKRESIMSIYPKKQSTQRVPRPCGSSAPVTRRTA